MITLVNLVLGLLNLAFIAFEIYSGSSPAITALNGFAAGWLFSSVACGLLEKARARE